MTNCCHHGACLLKVRLAGIHFVAKQFVKSGRRWGEGVSSVASPIVAVYAGAYGGHRATPRGYTGRGQQDLAVSFVLGQQRLEWLSIFVLSPRPRYMCKEKERNVSFPRSQLKKMGDPPIAEVGAHALLSTHLHLLVDGGRAVFHIRQSCFPLG